MRAAAILLCAGRGERLNAGVEKALAPLAGRPLFCWSLETLERAPVVEAIVVVGPVAKLQHALAATGLACRKIAAWTEGGRERQHSVGRGLHVLPEGITHVAIHDSARALVSGDLVGRVLLDAAAHGAALAALPLEDTLKRGTLDHVEGTVPRASIWRAQTPQAFRRDWIEEAHREAKGTATDDAALVESLGHPVRFTMGEALNFKITTPHDLALAEAWLTAHPVRS